MLRRNIFSRLPHGALGWRHVIDFYTNIDELVKSQK